MFYQKMRKKILSFLIILISLFFVYANVVSAAYECQLREAPNEKSLWFNLQRCRDCGECSLNDFVILAINVAQWILGISGSLALLAFVYGGIMFLISAGSSEKIEKAKKIMAGGAIGLIIIFASFTIIGFIFKALGINDDWFEIGWFEK